MTYCQRCGAPLEENSRYCQRCGAPVAAIHTAVPPPPIPHTKRSVGIEPLVILALALLAILVIVIIVIIVFFGGFDFNFTTIPDDQDFSTVNAAAHTLATAWS